MSKVKVCELHVIYDDPRYEGFAFAGDRSLLYPDSSDDMACDDFRGMGEGFGQKLEWEIPELAPVWRPRKVIGRVRNYNDFPCAGLGMVPVVSERAMIALKDLLEPWGGILPVLAGKKTYFAYNNRCLLNALDWKASEVDWMIQPFVASSISTYVFDAEAIGPVSIFRIPQYPTLHVVTELFKERAEAAQLQGMVFDLLWSDEDDQDDKHDEARGDFAVAEDFYGEQSMLIRVGFSRRVAAASRRATISQMMDVLDAALSIPKTTHCRQAWLRGTSSRAVREEYS